MEFLKIRLETKPDEKVFLEPMSDLHIGNRAVNYEKLHECIDRIKNDDNRYTLINGDLIDNIMAYSGGALDKRWYFDVEDPQLPETEDQIYEVVRLLEPIKHKILGTGPGNHEWKNNSISRKRFIHDFCKPLDTPYLGAMFMMNIQLQHNKKNLQNYEVWGCHGSFGGMRVGGSINRLQDVASVWSADVFLHGHVHEKAFYVEKVAHHDLKTNDIGYTQKMYILTGAFVESYVRGFDGYTDKNPRRRISKTGTISISLDPVEHKIHAYE